MCIQGKDNTPENDVFSSRSTKKGEGWGPQKKHFFHKGNI